MPAAVALDKEALRKEIAREERKKARAELAKLRSDLRAERARHGAAKAEAKAACTTGREAARAEALRLKEEAKASARAKREAARASCGIAKGEHGRKVREKRAALASEKKFQADIRRIEAGNRKKRPGVATARVAKSESDDEVRSNIPPEFVPLFDRVRRGIKATARESRTEAFLRYVEEHPREQYAAADDATDALIRELEQRQRYGNPSRPWTQLGLLTRLVYVDPRGKKKTMRWSLRSAPRLVYDASTGRPLVVVYEPSRLRAATSAEIRRYRKSHWGEEGCRLVSSGEIATRPVQSLGRGVSITYTTAKGAEGLGEQADWEHKWGEGASGKWTPPTVAAHACQSARCAHVGRVLLVGGTYRVTERGIVG